MAEVNKNDTDYQLFHAILDLVDSLGDYEELSLNEEQRYELLLFLYTYSFHKLYELKPAYKDLIFMHLQMSVFSYLVDYSNMKQYNKLISIDIEDFINQRAELYSSEINIMMSERNNFPSKLLYLFFESPLNINPSNSFNLTNHMIFNSLIIEPLSYINSISEGIIKYDFSFGNEFKYKKMIGDLELDSRPDLEALGTVLLYHEKCEKLWHPSHISGDIPRGRFFIEAVKSIKELKNYSREYFLMGSLMVFDKWIESYLDKYGKNWIIDKRWGVMGKICYLLEWKQNYYV